MASGSLPTAPSIVPPPPRPGLAYIAVIQPSLNLLLIGTVWSAFLVPITIALFFFSTPRIRRQPVFVLNVIALGIGLAEGAINIYNQTRVILAQPVRSDFDTAFACMCILAPIFAESILLFRVYAVYHPRRLSAAQRIAVYGPITIFKTARLINDILFVTRWVVAARHATDPLAAGQTIWHSPFVKIEWFLQLADNTFTSALFLLKLRDGIHQHGGAIHILGSDGRPCSNRLKTLFWIAASNFVFPIILSLAQLIFVFLDDNLIDGTYIFMVNNFVEIVGVLLATVWCTSSQGLTSSSDGGVSGIPCSTVDFASASPSSSTSTRRTDDRDNIIDIKGLGSTVEREKEYL